MHISNIIKFFEYINIGIQNFIHLKVNQFSFGN